MGFNKIRKYSTHHHCGMLSLTIYTIWLQNTICQESSLLTLHSHGIYFHEIIMTNEIKFDTILRLNISTYLFNLKQSLWHFVVGQ